MTKPLWAALCVALLAGCDYTTPLVTEPLLEMDPALAGLWSHTLNDGATQHLLILPVGPKEYLASFPAGTTNALFATARLWRQDSTELVQLQWLGTAQGAVPRDDRIYQYATYTLHNATLQLKLLNADIINDAFDHPDALASAIQEHAGHDRLFRQKIMFQRVNID